MRNEPDIGGPGKTLLICIGAIIDAATSNGAEEDVILRKLVAASLLAAAQMHFNYHGSDQEFANMASRALSFVNRPSAMDH